MGHADTLLALGGAFLAAAFLARLGGDVASFVPRLTLERTLARVRGPAAKAGD